MSRATALGPSAARTGTEPVSAVVLSPDSQRAVVAMSEAEETPLIKARPKAHGNSGLAPLVLLSTLYITSGAFTTGTVFTADAIAKERGFSQKTVHMGAWGTSLLAGATGLLATVPWLYMAAQLGMGLFLFPPGLTAWVLVAESIPPQLHNRMMGIWNICYSVFGCSFGMKQHINISWRFQSSIWYLPSVVIDQQQPSLMAGPMPGYLLASAACWSAVSMSFYALSYSSSSLSPDIYLNMALLAGIDAVVYACAMPFIELGQQCTECGSVCSPGDFFEVEVVLAAPREQKAPRQLRTSQHALCVSPLGPSILTAVRFHERGVPLAFYASPADSRDDVNFQWVKDNTPPLGRTPLVLDEFVDSPTPVDWRQIHFPGLQACATKLIHGSQELVHTVPQLDQWDSALRHEFLRSLALAHPSMHLHQFHVYTDGSAIFNTNSGKCAAWAFVVVGATRTGQPVYCGHQAGCVAAKGHQFELPGLLQGHDWAHPDSFAGECDAIFRALVWLLQHGAFHAGQPHFVVSDALSAVKIGFGEWAACKRPFLFTHVRPLERFAAAVGNLSAGWQKAHAGHLFNELADHIARTTANLACQPPVTPSDWVWPSCLDEHETALLPWLWISAQAHFQGQGVDVQDDVLKIPKPPPTASSDMLHWPQYATPRAATVQLDFQASTFNVNSLQQWTKARKKSTGWACRTQLLTSQTSSHALLFLQETRSRETKSWKSGALFGYSAAADRGLFEEAGFAVPDPALEKQPTAPWTCRLCGQGFDSACGHAVHMRQKHGLNAGVRQYMPFPSTCVCCLRDFFTLQKLRQHLQYRPNGCWTKLESIYFPEEPLPHKSAATNRMAQDDYRRPAQQLYGPLLPSRDQWRLAVPHKHFPPDPAVADRDLAATYMLALVEWHDSTSRASARPIMASIVPLDVIYHSSLCDLLCPASREFWCRMVGSAAFLGLLAAPPCETYSIARWQAWLSLDGGPAPVRAKDEPWGRLANNVRQQTQTLVSNQFMQIWLVIALIAIRTRTPFVMEHPAPPPLERAASIWATDELLKIQQIPGVAARVILQGLFGGISAKPTTLLSFDLPMLDGVLRSWRERSVNRTWQTLSGKLSTGAYATSLAKAYPEALNAALVEAFYLKAQQRHCTDATLDAQLPGGFDAALWPPHGSGSPQSGRSSPPCPAPWRKLQNY
eukprot:Skav223428  [mRNA]  locus=scaffold350:464814:488244:+ [translate_table: standard]